MSLPTTPQIHIRESLNVPQDADFIIAAFDTVLPYLDALGSGSQWGSQLFSEKAGFCDNIRGSVAAAEKFRLTGEGDKTRAFVAEVQVEEDEEEDEEVGGGGGDEEDDEKAAAAGLHYRYSDGGEPPATAEGRRRRYLQLGAAIVKGCWFPEYIKNQPQFAPTIAAAASSADDGAGDDDGNWVYLEVVISDYRTGPARKGSGAALVRRAREYAVAQGARTLFVDCWAGNGDKLVRFYESCGFKRVHDFDLERKDKDPWHGSLLRMELE